MNLSVPIQRMVRIPGRRAWAVLTAVGTLFVIAGICTPAIGSQSVAYQINPAHSGSQSDNVTPPLAQRWSRTFGGPVSYPLIADGKIFVDVANQPGVGTNLYALDEGNGVTLWGPIDLGGSYSRAGIAYDAGRVFAVNYSGILRAFDATSGSLLGQNS